MALEWEQSMRECRGETRDTCAAHFAYEFSNHLEGLSVEMPVYKAGEEKDQWKAKETIEEILENFAEPIRSEYQETRSVRLQLKEELDNLIRSSECD